MINVADGLGLVASLKWQDTYYGLWDIDTGSDWQLASSHDGVDWQFVADLSAIAKPDFYDLTRYNDYLFFPSTEAVYFYDGSKVGNCTTELNFPGGSSTNHLKALKGTNNGLIFAYEDLFYYQILVFAPQVVSGGTGDLPTIIPDAIIHQTDYFQGVADSLGGSAPILAPTFILPFHSDSYSAMEFSVNEHFTD